MRIQSNACLAITALMLSAGAVGADTGYYVQRPIQATIPSGPTSNFGTPVAVLTQAVEPGSYLITARIDGQSTAPNSGATCYFTYYSDAYHEVQIGTQYYTVNTSSDWSHQVNTSVVALNRFTTDKANQVKLVCSHGYLYSNSSIVGGEMTLTPVGKIGS